MATAPEPTAPSLSVRRVLAGVVALSTMLTPARVSTGAPAYADNNPGGSSSDSASVSNAVFTGGTVTTSAGVYTKSGTQLTLAVTTSANTKCVAIRGAFNTSQTTGVGNSGKSSWT